MRTFAAAIAILLIFAGLVHECAQLSSSIPISPEKAEAVVLFLGK